MTIAWFFGILGLICLFLGFQFVYNPLNMAQLSMNVFHGETTHEHHQGLTWKWLWFKLQGVQIKMNATIIITSGGILMMDWDKFITEKVYEKIAPRIYETKDTVLYGSWATAIRPARGFLFNFLLKTPQVGALMTMSKIDLEISDYLTTLRAEEALGQKKYISDTIIGGLFGGDDEKVSSEIEETYGIIISNPQLFDLNYGKKSQDAAEKLFEAKKFNESMVLLEKQIADPDKRANAIFIANGLIKKNVYDVEGLALATKNIADAFASIFTKKN